MNREMWILVSTAISIGFLHTLLGPDHYLPFIVLAKARKWNNIKTTWITFLCGLGHVLSSVLLGFIGVGLGLAVFKLEKIESFRGDIAGWMLLALGFTYTVWGIYRLIRNKPHKHPHLHIDGHNHIHSHKHKNNHLHIHSIKKEENITPWVLFIIFIFGPCEPLIPLLIYPAAKGSIFSAIIVAAAFSITTIITMIFLVLAGSFGLAKLPLKKIEKYAHVIAGFLIFVSGIAIKFLGL